MSSTTERLSLTAAVLVAILALPCLDRVASAFDCRLALADGAARIGFVRAAFTRAVTPAAVDGRAHRSATKPPSAVAPHRGKLGSAKKVQVFNINA